MLLLSRYQEMTVKTNKTMEAVNIFGSNPKSP